MSSNWTKPTDLSFPLTARGLEDINSMFQKLFSKFPLALNRGGTGSNFSTVNVGDLIYGDLDASNNPMLALLASVAPGSYLRSGGVATAPVWSTLKLPNTAAVGDILIASTLDTITGLAIGAAGTVIRSNGTIPANSGFTIPNTFAQGDVLYGSATNVVSGLVKDATATRYLSNKGTANAPLWSQITLSNGVTGVLGETNGGTAQSAVVIGDILRGGGVNTWQRLATGVTAGMFLRSNGTGIGFQWSTLTIANTGATGGIMHASATNAATFLAIGTVGKVLRTTGSLPVWSTFTMPDTYAQGDLLYGSATNVLSALADVAVGSVLISGGVGVAPAWSASPAVTLITATSVVGAPTQTGLFRNTNASGGGALLHIDRPTDPRVAALGFTTAGTPEWYIGVMRDGGSATQKLSINLGNDLTLSATATKLVIDTAGNVGIGTTAPGTALTINKSALAVTAIDALALENLTASTVGVPVQHTPRTRFRGSAWNSTSGASNTSEWAIWSEPVTGLVPSTRLWFQSSLNGAAYASSMRLDNDGATVIGTLSTTVHVVATGNVFGSSLVCNNVGGDIGWTTRSRLFSPADGQVNVNRFDSSTGVGLDVLTDAILRVRTRAQTADATISALRLSLPNTGAAATCGNNTMVAGTFTVNTTSATATCLVFAQRKTAGGTIGFSSTYTINAGVSFTFTSDNVLDTSVYSWHIIETH